MVVFLWATEVLGKALPAFRIPGPSLEGAEACAGYEESPNLLNPFGFQAESKAWD